MINVSNIAAN